MGLPARTRALARAGLAALVSVGADVRGCLVLAATKSAVHAMILILAEEMRGRYVIVNAVQPGPTATPLFLDGKPQEAVDHRR